MKKWKKNLYENEGYPDNYTDVTFLDELRKNVNVENVSFRCAVLGAGLVTQEICTVVLFAVVFVYLYNEWINPETVLFQSSIITALGYIIHRILGTSDSYYSTLVKDLRTVLIFLVFGYVLSPILKTLTDTISTDTIFAMSTLMMIIHIVFFDYGVPAGIVSSALSLNAAIFGSICLASRLASAFHAFVLLTITVECFALLPLLLARIKNSLLLLTAVVMVVLYALYTVSITMAVLFACVITFITLLCPYLFLRWQSYKDNIYGPWDEAVVHDEDM
ncbi:phosphatidylinositol N-acetylglucosaminyltransferase subunit C [Anabrus simplex]|uniref:phosphatidylinositol N-acetylglucosaminyltransferase subunit C n=1 Tax=Anabrus simplex TaxID=316456 RepID=UPI0035A35E5E